MKLSICIPTYHGRYEALWRTVDGIPDQAAGNLSGTPKPLGSLQARISGTASEDGTQSLVAAYSHRYPGMHCRWVHPRTTTRPWQERAA